jgi:hypothetical protein
MTNPLFDKVIIVMSELSSAALTHATTPTSIMKSEMIIIPFLKLLFTIISPLTKK